MAARERPAHTGYYRYHLDGGGLAHLKESSTKADARPAYRARMTGNVIVGKLLAASASAARGPHGRMRWV